MHVFSKITNDEQRPGVWCIPRDVPSQMENSALPSLASTAVFQEYEHSESWPYSKLFATQCSFTELSIERFAFHSLPEATNIATLLRQWGTCMPHSRDCCFWVDLSPLLPVYSNTTSLVKQDLNWMRRSSQCSWTELSVYHVAEASMHVFSMSTNDDGKWAGNWCIQHDVESQNEHTALPSLVFTAVF